MSKKIKDLQQAFKNEKQDARFAKKASAVLLYLEGGISVESISKSTGQTQPSIYRWIERFEEVGIEGLKDLPKSG